MREFTVWYQSHGCARLPKDEPDLNLELVDPESGAVTSARFSTLALDEGWDSPLPRGLAIQVHGGGVGLDEAIRSFRALAGNYCLLMSFAANAYSGQPTEHFGFECTPGLEERDFWQRSLPHPAGIPASMRDVPTKIIGRVFERLMGHPEESRIYRVLAQYHAALANWSEGRKILALGHLYMAVEALTPVVLRQAIDGSGGDVKALAAAWGIDSRLPPREHRQQLDRHARIRLVFDGDEDCYKFARRASDAFEHGLSDFAQVAKDVDAADRRLVARYVRRAAARAVGLSEDEIAILMEGTRHEPLEALSPYGVLRGALRGDVRATLVHGTTAPHLLWDEGVVKAFVAADGKLQMTITRTLRPVLPNGMTLDLVSVETWGPSSQSR